MAMDEDDECYIGTCPACGARALKIIENEHAAPLVGRLLTITLRCEVCGYRDVSVYNVEAHEPTRITFKVEARGDLNARVIRSPTAKVTIPEFGAEIRPGVAAEGFVSNVEGVLQRVLDAAELLLEWAGSPDKRRRAEEVINEIKKAMSGERTFHVIIEDPYGNSAIVGSESKLTVERVKQA